MGEKRKVRVDLRKNRSKPPREHGWTRDYHAHGFAEENATHAAERVRAKGDLSRRRTIIAEGADPGRPADADGGLPTLMPAVNLEECLHGRVLRVHGLQSVVEVADGRQYTCAVRRLLRNLVID